MKNISDFSVQKNILLGLYDRILGSNLLIPVQDINVTKVQVRKKSLEEEKFVIAVCGQVKAGKSTIINALVFGKPVLPYDDTVMTAKNTLLVFDEKSGFEARFYTPEEWKELRESLNQEANQEALESRGFFEQQVQEAAEKGIVVADQICPGGKIISRGDLAELKDYVSVGGKLSPFVREAIVKYPHKWLEQVRIADTPGINDPNPVRDKVTKEWIHNADAVVFVSYAGQALAEEDVRFIDQYLLHVPSNRRVVAINKIDCIPETKSIQRWIEGLRSGDDKRLKVILKDLDSIVYVCGLGGLIAAMIEGHTPLYDLSTYREILDREGFLDPDRNGLERLRKLIEERLIQNKGTGIIESHTSFIDSIFERNERVLDERVGELREKLDLLGQSHTELRRKNQELLDLHNKLHYEIENFETDLLEVIENNQAEVQDAVDKIRRDIVSSIRTRIKQEVRIIDNYKNDVCWIVLDVFESKQVGLFKIMREYRREAQDVIIRKIDHLRENLINYGGFSVGRLQSRMRVTSLPVLNGMKEMITNSLSKDKIGSVVNDVTTSIQRFFDTTTGFDEALSSVMGIVNETLNKSFSNFVNVSSDIIAEQTTKIISDTEEGVNSAIDRTKEFLDGVLKKIIVGEKEKKKIQKELENLEKRQSDIRFLRVNILNKS